MAVLKFWDGTKWDSVNTGPGGIEVYYQPTQPATTQIGAIWIDTDESPLQTSGSVPAGGTPGQILQKDTTDDYDVSWAPPPVSGITGQTYAITAGYTKDRAMNPQAMNLGEVATVLATLIDDMIAAGLIKP